MGIKHQTYFDNGKWTVYEIETDQEIAFFDHNEDALEYCQFLNLGGAFDGYTPRFMFNGDTKYHNIVAQEIDPSYLESTSKEIDIDDYFSNTSY